MDLLDALVVACDIFPLTRVLFSLSSSFQIKAAVKKLYDINVAKINTLIRSVSSMRVAFFFTGWRFVVSLSHLSSLFPLRHVGHSPDGQKKAYIRLHADQEALDIANKVCVRCIECFFDSENYLCLSLSVFLLP